MKFIRKIFFFIIVLSVPVLLFMNVNQSFRYERLATEIDSFELEQKEWLEENKKNAFYILSIQFSGKSSEDNRESSGIKHS